jgi:multidrug efflux pump subunit AcrA (membrane-fusion protein)
MITGQILASQGAGFISYVTLTYLWYDCHLQFLPVFEKAIHLVDFTSWEEERIMRKYLVTILVIITLGVIGYFGFRVIRNRQQANSISNLETVTASKGSLTATVGATGMVHPDQTAIISWQTPGIVDNVYVQVGQVITNGETLSDLTRSSLPQSIILAESDLIAARNSVSALTNPNLSTVTTSEKALAAAQTKFQQAQNDLSNAIITNQNANDKNSYDEWLASKTALDIARNALPLVNTSIDVQAFYQAVRESSQLQEDLAAAQANTDQQPDDSLFAERVTALESSLQGSVSRQNSLQSGLDTSTIELVKNLSDSTTSYESATRNFISTVITDTLSSNIDLAQVQADLTQKQSSLINLQSTLTDQVNQRQNMNGKRCDDDTIADYQDAYDKALDLYNFTGHIVNSKEYQLLQTATANLNWCTAVWSEEDIAAQDAKIASTQAQIQLLQAQITSDQSQISNSSNSVYGLAIYLNNIWASYQDASQQLNDAVTNLYHLERVPDPDDLAAAQARLQAAQSTVDSQYLTSPFAGTITEVNIKPGDQVSIGSPAFRLDNLERLLVDVQVSEVDINSVKQGQLVSLSFDAIQDKQYAGVVSQVAPVGNAVQGVVNFNVTVELTDADENVKPGMTAAVNIIVDQINDKMLVPNRAVRVVDGKQVVYILDNGLLKQIEVVLGSSSDSQSEVLSGDLQVGDQIILNPPQDILGMNGPFGR